jgi:hypothetical protein
MMKYTVFDYLLIAIGMIVLINSILGMLSLPNLDTWLSNHERSHVECNVVGNDSKSRLN